jgi:NADH-quinone oxidoreductase subunit C
MADLQALLNQIQNKIGSFYIQSHEIALEELTLEIQSQDIPEFCRLLRDDPSLRFEMLMDICGIDYLNYGVSEWTVAEATRKTFSRGVEENALDIKWDKPRFAVVYHLLSITHNHRVRLKTFALGEPPMVPSVIDIWNSANWYEREAFDLYGVLFEGHPDLRRILTDYGFIGHPFRKDFPLIGHVEMRYCASKQRVIYEPVSIESRTLVPKTIRDDNRYLIDES